MKFFAVIKSPAFYFASSQVLYLVLTTMLITVGYIVTPVLFEQLSSKIAGDIAGILFQFSGYITLAFLVLLLIWQLTLKVKFSFSWPNVLSFSIMLILLWWINPLMSEIKAKNPLGVTHNSADWPLFASLHGAYQIGYLLVIIMLILGMVKSAKALRLSMIK